MAPRRPTRCWGWLAARWGAARSPLPSSLPACRPRCPPRGLPLSSGEGGDEARNGAELLASGEGLAVETHSGCDGRGQVGDRLLASGEGLAVETLPAHTRTG